MSAAKKQCKREGCENSFVQYNSLSRYCSGHCELLDKLKKPLSKKFDSKLKRRSIKAKAKKKPTADQAEIHARLREMGCAVGKFVYGKDGTPPDIHHIVENNRRLGEGFVIPLEPRVHRQGTAEYPSIHSVNGKHGGKQAFKDVYGLDEYELLALCEKELGVEYSKVFA